MKKLCISTALLGLLATNCALVTGETGEPSGVDMEEPKPSQADLKLDGLSAVPAYFNHDNRYMLVGDDADWIYAHFDSYPGRSITVDLHQTDAEQTSVGFKVYEVLDDGSLRLVTAVDGSSGRARYTFESKGTGAYVVEMVSSGHLRDLSLNLSCGEDRCSPEGQPKELCSGIQGVRCAEGLFCAYALESTCGASDQSGVCSKKPDACIQLYRPVCGCDDRTYGNACSAASAGVSVKNDGPCAAPVAMAGDSCGGFRAGPAPVCDQGLYCNYERAAICGRADAAGTCAARPEACTDEYAPVCGCDGQTYPNACSAALNGVAVLDSGACSTQS